MQFDVSESSELLKSAMSLGWSAITAIVIFAVGWVISKRAYAYVLGLSQKRSKDPMLGRFLASLAQWGVIAAAGISALGRVGVETTSLVALLASAGLAVGLALKDNLANFASGVMILIFRPLSIGDTVVAAGCTGTVTDIGLFASTLVTPENHTIILPNSAVTGGPLTNFTRLGTRRGTVEVGVAYGSDLQAVRAVLLEAATGADQVLADPAPAVVFGNLGASSLDFKVQVWADADHYMPMLDQVRSRVYDGLNAAGIDIPFAQIVVHQAAPVEA